MDAGVQGRSDDGGAPGAAASVILPIARVTVHPDGALVTRRGAAAVREGALLGAGLPLLLDEGSLRVAVSPGAVTGMRVTLDVEGASRTGEADAARAVFEARHAVRRLQVEEEALRTQRGWLGSLAPGRPGRKERGAVPPPARLAGWAALEEPVDAWASALDARLHALDAALEAATEVLRVAEARARAASSEELWRHWQPTRLAHLQVDGEGEVAVELSYRVIGATWSPVYALYADGAFRRGRFAMRALVAQATGEDWNGVQLGLSTAPCRRMLDVPALPALRLGSRQAQAPTGWRPLPEGLDALFPPDLAAPAPPAAAERILADITIEEEADELTVEMDVAAQAVPVPPPAPTASMSVRMAPPSPRRRAEAVGGVAGSLSRASEAGAAAPPSPREEEAVVLQAAVLDYGRLRLASFDARPGRRGRLQLLSAAAEAGELGLPPHAVGWLARELADRRRSLRGLPRRALPPRHTLPGPIEGADHRYEPSGICDIPSDGAAHRVGVRDDAVDLRVQLRAVPRDDPRVFRTVRCELPDATPLPPGPADVFVDGSLALSLIWSGSAAGGLELGAGPEDGLVLVRNVRYSEESAGFLGGRRRMHTSIEVTVASSLGHGVEVELLERLPVAGDADVAVSLVGATPEASRYEGEPDGPVLAGGYRQRLQVEAGGEARATFAYDLVMGGKQEIEGGDRRG